MTRPMCFYYGTREDHCFSVSSDDLLTPQEVIDNWGVVEIGDYEEAVSVYSHDVFEIDALECHERRGRHLGSEVEEPPGANRRVQMLRSRFPKSPADVSQRPF
eukprot:5390216-Pyramimonas_sp.AAC.1